MSWLICAAMIKCLSYGMGYGELVAKPEEIIPAIKRGYASGKPAIINVEVDQVSLCPLTAMFGLEFKELSKC